MYWTPPPPMRPLDPPPLLKSDDLLLGNQEILDPPPLSKILDTPLINNVETFIQYDHKLILIKGKLKGLEFMTRLINLLKLKLNLKINIDVIV